MILADFVDQDGVARVRQGGGVDVPSCVEYVFVLQLGGHEANLSRGQSDEVLGRLRRGTFTVYKINLETI